MIKSIFKKYDDLISSRVSDERKKIFLLKLPVKVLVLAIVLILVGARLISPPLGIAILVTLYLVTSKKVKIGEITNE